MSDFQNARVRAGIPGIAGAGLTSGEKTAINTDLTALKAVAYVTKTASATTSAEIALDALGGPGLLKVAADGTLSVAVAADLPAHTNTVTVGGSFLIDGGGATITTGIKGDLQIPFAGTITGWTVLADQTGSISIAVWKDTYANYPPVVGDLLFTASITTSNKNTATGLSHSVAAGDVLRFNVGSVTSHQRVTVALTMTRAV